MAQYKVPQNVESEDKILGPLSLKQFIYVIIALMWGFLMWRIFISTPLIAVVAALPVSGVFLALGLIQREEQSFENYFIAMVRFVLVPRRRIWHKDDVKDIFKKPVQVKRPEPTFHRDPSEVKGQLQKLALVVDTRGKTPKSADIQLPDTANQSAAIAARVNAPAETAKPAVQVTAADDILDMDTSAQAATIGQLLENVEANIRSGVKKQMENPTSVTMPPPSPTKNQGDIMDLALNQGGMSVATVANAAKRNNNIMLEENKTTQVRQ